MMNRCGVYKGAGEQILRRYVKRGIIVSDEWRCFPTFERWALANGYEKGLQLDRIDNTRGYSPDNCRFVTRSQNNRNRRDNICLPNGWLLIDWYDEFKTSVSPTYVVFRNRLKLGWGAHDALYTPKSKTRKNS